MKRTVVVISCICLTLAGAGCQKKSPVNKNTVSRMGESRLTMVIPFTKAADIASINEAFSVSDQAPWGFAHNGIDFFPTTTGKTVQAVASGTIRNISLAQNEKTKNWQVGVTIKLGAYSAQYAFEIFSTAKADGELQLKHIVVKNGQTVKPGDVLGTLDTIGHGAHLHFGVVRTTGGQAVCPGGYFTVEARTAIITILQSHHPGWQLCYS